MKRRQIVRMGAVLLVLGGVLSPCSLQGAIEIGWGEVDITPPATKRIPLCGQYYQRIATGIHTPIAITAVAIRNGKDYFLTASYDNVSVREGLIDEIREGVKKRIPEIDVSRLSINCVHSHCAPNIGNEGLVPSAARLDDTEKDLWGPSRYEAFVVPKLVEAYCQAWANLKPGSIARAKGFAEIGHCRIAMYLDGHGEMYGDTTRPDFAGMSDGEDPKVEMLFTYDGKGAFKGAIFNVACPAQVMEATYKVSGDICGVLRQKMKAIYGDDFRVIYQPAASGCQSPRDLVRGYRDALDGWHEDTCDLLAERLVKCAKEATVMPRETDPVVKAVSCRISLPRRRVTSEEVAAAEKRLEKLRAKYGSDERMFADFLAYLHANEAKGGPGPYDSKDLPFVYADIAKAVIARGKDQDTKKDLAVEVCAMRVGDVAFVTCPFELYLMYGQIIKARSAAKQTFVMELCNGDYGYVPSPAVIKSRSYGSGVNNGEVGPDGGYKLADESVKAIEQLFLSSLGEPANSFGRLSDGRETKLWRLKGAGGLVVDVSDFGGRIVRVYAPDRKGKLADVALGWNTAAEYEKYGAYMGTIVGRYAGRIADGRFVLDGKEYRLDCNETQPVPRHSSLHGGPVGWDAKIWKATPHLDDRNPSIELSLVSEDGDQGFPGRIMITVTYTVTADNRLIVSYRATTDRPTIINPTHHGYWNLAGATSGEVLGHELQVFADEYTAVDERMFPIKNVPVEGTVFDLRQRGVIGEKKAAFAAYPKAGITAGWYDHNFVLRGENGILKAACVLRDPESGRQLEVWTTEPAMQLYGAHEIRREMRIPTKAEGQILEPFAGFAIETQHIPDSQNHPEFPSTVLRPGETFTSTTEYRFSAS